MANKCTTRMRVDRWSRPDEVSVWLLLTPTTDGEKNFARGPCSKWVSEIQPELARPRATSPTTLAFIGCQGAHSIALAQPRKRNMKKAIVAVVVIASIAAAYAADPESAARVADPVVEWSKWTVKCNGSMSWDDVTEPKNINGGFSFRTRDSEIRTTAGMNCVAVGSFRKQS